MSTDCWYLNMRMYIVLAKCWTQSALLFAVVREHILYCLLAYCTILVGAAQ